MSLKEVQERIRKKKRRRRKRLITLLLILLSISAGIFAVKAPYFRIGNVLVQGNEKIPTALIENEAEDLLGQNIFLYHGDDLETFMQSQPYFQDMEIQRKFPSDLVITITEKKPEVNYYHEGIVSLLTKNGVLLEAGANPIEGVTLVDQVTLPGLGENIYRDHPEKIKVLEEFRYLQERNISDISFTEIDLTDMKNIRTYYNELEIRLGYPDSLKEKLNAAINIISGGQLEAVKGYIDLAYVEEPVVYDEAMIETPTDGSETPTDGN
jgi:cell division protein FtsQ